MNPHRVVSVALLCSFLSFLIVGCHDSTPLGPAPRALLSGARDAAPNAGAPGLTALTWNVYVGAEIERVMQARTPDEVVALATQEWANVQATNFPARAGALARAIAARRPHVVGLQELALYRTTDRPFEELATQVAYDFLQLLLDSLRGSGLDYAAVAVDRTTDIQVPVISGFDASGRPILAGVRFTDGDAVLVRNDVPNDAARTGVYAAFVPVTLGGVTTGVYQGWSSVDVTVGGRVYRVVATHLAGQEVAEIQVAQTRELLALLAGDSRPMLLVGDFNSDAFGADPTRATATYGLVRDAEFGDSWSAPGREAPGLTCCQQPDLRNPQSTFNQRIDFIFGRNLPEGARPIRREVVGDRPGDRTPGGLWPSDHGGVVTTFSPGSPSGTAVRSPAPPPDPRSR